MPPFYSELYIKFYTDLRINSETIVPFKLITCGEETINSNYSDDIITLSKFGIAPVTYILEDQFTIEPASYQIPEDCQIKYYKFT